MRWKVATAIFAVACGILVYLVVRSRRREEGQLAFNAHDACGKAALVMDSVLHKMEMGSASTWENDPDITGAGLRAGDLGYPCIDAHAELNGELSESWRQRLLHEVSELGNAAIETRYQKAWSPKLKPALTRAKALFKEIGRTPLVD